MRLTSPPKVGSYVRYTGGNAFSTIHDDPIGSVFLVRPWAVHGVGIDTSCGDWGLNEECYWSEFEGLIKNDRSVL